MSPEDFLAGLLTSPDFLFQDADFVNHRGLLVKLDEAAIRQASFLDNRAFRKDTLGVWMPVSRILDQLEKQPPAPKPLHAIFHVSHCGSTLVSRMLAELPGCLPIREPLLFLALAQSKREDRAISRLDEGMRDRIFDALLLHFSRTYRPGDRALVKPTSACGNLLDDLLRRSPESKALLLHTDLETWLAAMMRNDDIRHNGRFYAAAWLTDLRAMTGDTRLRLSAMSDAEQFAVNWLTTMLHFERATQAHAGRAQRLDFETLMADPAARLADTGRFLDLDPARAPEVVTGPLMKSYAKNPQKSYDQDARLKQFRETRASHGEEIAAGLKFAEKLCKEIPELSPLSAYFTRS